ncbi:MAG: hypothetical protein RL131_1000 [Bacteroidota bacterium]
MIQLQFPEPAFRIKKEEERALIFDEIRKKWVHLQPEEWVRQNMVQYLIQSIRIPKSAIAIEKKIQLKEGIKRFDILAYDAEHKPWMMVECKAEKITLNEKTLMQILSYNLHIPVRYLVITNGIACHVADKKAEEPYWLSAFPNYE